MGNKYLPDYKIFTNTIFFAHRGTPATLIPENTLASITNARNMNFKAVEFDLQQTKDGKFVLFHDKTGNKLLHENLTIPEYNLNELKRFHLYDLRNFLTKLNISTLDEVLERNADSLYYYLDMKGYGRKSYFSLSDEIAEKIKKLKLEKRTIVASASLLFICYTEFNHPELNTALEGFGSGKEWIYYLIPQKFRPDFLSSFASEVDSSHVNWLKEHNLIGRKIIYGVDETNYKKMKEYGIKKMIIDYGSYLDKNLQE